MMDGIRSEYDKEVNREYIRLYRLAFPELRRAKANAYRIKYPERVRALKHRHYIKHRAEIRARVKKWSNINKDKVRERSRKRRREQLELVRFWARRWARKNKHKALEYCNRRRACIKHSMSHQDREMVRKVYKRASVLRQWFDVVVDHIVPLAKGGEHLARNMQIIYRHENESKNARLGYKPTVIFL